MAIFFRCFMPRLTLTTKARAQALWRQTIQATSTSMPRSRLGPRRVIRPIRFIVARYDLTFPLDLSHEAIAEARRNDLPLDVVWLPCGHYTTGELPWKAIDAWKIATFFRKQFR